MAQIKFGTDGWRAVIADEFTYDNVARVTQAAADYWVSAPQQGTSRRAVIGYDRRFASDLFGRCAAEVLAGNGFEVILAPEPTPTPSVSFAVKATGSIGGIMITASHNPPRFSGFKLKTHLGAPADPETCKKVEAMLDRRPLKRTDFEEAVASRQIRIKDLRPAHYKALKRLVDFKLVAESKLRFAHEALFGVGAGCFDQLLAGTTCRVTTLNGAHDPLFGGINPEPVEKNYVYSSRYLRSNPHDLCLVTDGDADRVGGMDGRGNYLSTHQLICLLLRHCLVNRKGKGRVVKALTTTSMVDKMCAAYGLEMVETGVGFKFIAEEMIKGGVLLGGEESGGIGFPGHIPERDGIAAGMVLLEMLAMERAPLPKLVERLSKEFGPHFYDRLDTHFPLDKRAELMSYLEDNPPDKLLSSSVIDVKTFDGVKFVARDSSWLMLRGSGTEPILRIYAEASDPVRVDRLLRLGKKLSQTVL